MPGAFQSTYVISQMSSSQTELNVVLLYAGLGSPGIMFLYYEQTKLLNLNVDSLPLIY